MPTNIVRSHLVPLQPMWAPVARCTSDRTVASWSGISNSDPARQIQFVLKVTPDDTFNFPLQSVESVTPIDDFTLLVGLDNNYPGGNGRVPGTPDDTELITLRSKVPLRTLRVQPCKDASTGARNGHDDPKGSKGCR